MVESLLVAQSNHSDFNSDSNSNSNSDFQQMQYLLWHFLSCCWFTIPSMDAVCTHSLNLLISGIFSGHDSRTWNNVHNNRQINLLDELKGLIWCFELWCTQSATITPGCICYIYIHSKWDDPFFVHHLQNLHMIYWCCIQGATFSKIQLKSWFCECDILYLPTQ